MARQTSKVRIIHAGGLEVLTTLEVDFLESMIPLFQITSTVPRANLEICYCHTLDSLLDALFRPGADVIHLSCHGTANRIYVGEHDWLTPTALKRAARASDVLIEGAVLATGCQLFSDAWVSAFRDAEATAYVAAKRAISPRESTIFSASFCHDAWRIGWPSKFAVRGP